jgi:hypothetical protein
MINRVQIGYPAVMKVATLPKPISIDEYLKKPIIEKKQLDWEKDMELKSRYLDKKVNFDSFEFISWWIFLQ